PIALGESNIHIEVGVTFDDQASEPQSRITLHQRVDQEISQLLRNFCVGPPGEFTSKSADMGVEFVPSIAPSGEQPFGLREQRLGAIPVFQPCEPIRLSQNGLGTTVLRQNGS
ncbi:MAG TPA: hypothetical protein VKT81_13330, partial [Bryobacteraceae bacterium]|nr:hypothetical protein [Bryobacteraceae bacterium]